MERLSPFELDQLSSSPVVEYAPSPPAVLQTPSLLSSSPFGPASELPRQRQHTTNTMKGEGARDEDALVMDDIEDEDEDEEEENPSELRRPALITDFSINADVGGDDDEPHSETERLLGDGGRHDDGAAQGLEDGTEPTQLREPTTSLDPAFMGEDGMKMADLGSISPSAAKKKRVSWVDEEEKGRDSVVFGAVTAVFTAPSAAEYDRSPSAGYLRRRQRRMQRRQRIMLSIFVTVFFLVISGLLALLILLLTGHLSHSSSPPSS